jgi:hypothetical protein
VADLNHPGNHRQCTSDKNECLTGWGDVNLYARQASMSFFFSVSNCSFASLNFVLPFVVDRL